MNIKTRILNTVSIYHAINDGSVTIIPILFPIFKSAFNLSYTQIGIITGLGLMISLVAQLMIGRISDGKNFRTILSMGIMLLSISLFLLTKSQGFLSLIFFIIILRIASSFFHPIGTGWISRIFKKDNLDRAMGIQSGFADIGVFIAITTTLYLSELKTWEFPLYLWSIVAAVVLLIGIYHTRNIEDSNLLVPRDKKKQSFRESILEAYVLLKKIKILVPAMMISGAGWGIITTYLPLLIVEKTNIPLSYIGLLIGLWIGTGSIASFFYGRITMFFGRKKNIIISYLLIGFTTILLAFFINLLIIIPALIILGFALFQTYPALASFISEETHESVEGKTFGLIFTLQLGGGTLLLFIGGFISDLLGIWSPFLLLGILTLMLTILLIINYKQPFVKKE